jgi:hypothetical protein
MKKIFFLIVFLIIFRLFCLSLNQNFKLVKIIGGDQSDCFFYGISDAILTPNKDIIILDARENFIARFDWNGKFINRIGRKGRGAGDLNWPTSAGIFNGKLYILDKFNNRLVETDPELKNLRYFKLPHNINMPSVFNVIDEKKFVIDTISIQKPDGPKICIIERTGKISTKINKMFFNHTPIEINSKSKDRRALLRSGYLFSVVYAMDDDKKEMLITSRKPDNVMFFYLYSPEGKSIKKFSYQMDEKYHFSYYLFKNNKPSLSLLKGRYNVDIGGIFYYNGHWYIFVNIHHYKDGDYELTIGNLKKYAERKSFYLKFDKAGKLVGKFLTDPSFICFHISKDGYVLGKHPDLEAEQLMIYKILK